MGTIKIPCNLALNYTILMVSATGLSAIELYADEKPITCLL